MLRESQLRLTLNTIGSKGAVLPKTLTFDRWSGEQLDVGDHKVPPDLSECLLQAPPLGEVTMSIQLDELAQRSPIPPAKRLPPVAKVQTPAPLALGSPPLPAAEVIQDLGSHDVFISYSVESDASTFQTVRTAFEALGLNVFNPDMDMSRLRVDGGASGELMQQHVRASKIVLAVLSRNGPIFKSPWCLMELRAAKAAGIPIIPIYNGDVSALNDIKDHINGNVNGLEQGSEIFEDLVKYIFKEQILELVSTQHASEVAKRLKEIARRIHGMPSTRNTAIKVETSRLERARHTNQLTQSRVSGMHIHLDGQPPNSEEVAAEVVSSSVFRGGGDAVSEVSAVEASATAMLESQEVASLPEYELRI